MVYDLIVIGAGPGGFAAAVRASQLGLKTLLIEKGPVGGLCLNLGCIPSKSLLLDAFAIAKQGTGQDVAAVFRKMHQKKNTAIETLRKNMEALLRGNGIDLVRGRAEFGSLSGEKGSYTVTVEGHRTPYAGRHLLLATGTSPHRTLGSFQADGEKILTSDELVQLEAIPATLVVIGGGSVGCEFASLFAALGSRVTLLEMTETLLPRFDRELSRELERAFIHRGILVKTSRKVVGIERGGQEVTVSGVGPDATQETYQGERVLLSVGRDPSGSAPKRFRTDARHFLEVDSSFQTTVSGVYGVGDLNGKSLLAHAASFQGRVAAEALAGRKKRLNQAIPDCVYTHPEVAKVGLTSEEAQAAAVSVRVGRASFGANAKALLLEEPAGFVKLIGESSSGRLLGAHLIGPGVSELIAELALALRLKATVRDLAETIHPHPTLSEAIVEAALDFCGESLYKLSGSRRRP